MLSLKWAWCRIKLCLVSHSLSSKRASVITLRAILTHTHGSLACFPLSHSKSSYKGINLVHSLAASYSLLTSFDFISSPSVNWQLFILSFLQWFQQFHRHLHTVACCLLMKRKEKKKPPHSFDSGLFFTCNSLFSFPDSDGRHLITWK